MLRRLLFIVASLLLAGLVAPGPAPASASQRTAAPTSSAAPVTAVRALVDSTRATVYWHAPLAAHPTGYRITSYPGSGACTMGPEARRCVITGLRNNVTYLFAVRAIYNGDAASPATATATPRPAPSAIPWVWVTLPTVDRVRIRWSEPAYVGSTMVEYRPPWFGYDGRLVSDDPELKWNGWFFVDRNYDRDITLEVHPGHSYTLWLWASNPYGGGPRRTVSFHT